MDWCDIEDILIDGTKEKISDLVCPDCGSKIEYRYDTKLASMEIHCLFCGYLSRQNKFPYPKCVDYFGDSAIV